MCRSDPTHDGTLEHAWLFEPTTSDSNRGSLTDEGLDHIAAHKYKPGHYTFLDNFFNPFWTSLTDLLPLSLAPNMVTTMGGLHCALSYALVWYHSPQLDTTVPSWVVFLTGYCTLAYYTLDCMDGKQARRTGASSPLGQLFDHGFDCICNLAHVSAVGGYTTMGGSAWFLLLQATLQFSFFMAQWEEYYTHVLPHAMGPFGVTEMNYGMGLFTIANAFVDREYVWTTKLRSHIVTYMPSTMVGKVQDILPDSFLELRFFSAVLFIWFATVSILIVGSLIRVLPHENVTRNKTHLSALSKLLTPLFIGIAPFYLPQHIYENETRFISISMGLLFSFLTKKMICFSMAKMSFASIQMEAIPFWAVILWIRYDENITELGATVLFGALCVWYTYRLTDWARVAIDQICKRLDIYCFTIKDKSKTD